MAVTTSAGESPLACKGLRVQIHLHLALFAAVRPWDCSAFHVRQLDTNEVDAQVEKLLLGKPLPESPN